MSVYKLPWVEVDPGKSVSFEKELEKETAENKHALAGLKVKALAQRQDNDDVLFELQDGTNRVAVAHLTYSHTPETSDKFPVTVFFDSFDKWLSEGMEKDVTEFNK